MDETHAPPQESKETILVVDDDASVLAVVSELLIDGGYSVITAHDGVSALQQSRKFKGTIDLLLSDFQMPEMSGVELATVMTSERNGLKVLPSARASARSRNNAAARV
jgi:CheY-like chemotaxis protein